MCELNSITSVQKFNFPESARNKPGSERIRKLSWSRSAKNEPFSDRGTEGFVGVSMELFLIESVRNCL